MTGGERGSVVLMCFGRHRSKVSNRQLEDSLPSHVRVGATIGHRLELEERGEKCSGGAHQMEDYRRRVGCIRAGRSSSTSCREQKELCPSDLALVEPFTQDLVLNGLEGGKVAADRRREQGGEQLDLFLRKDGLQWDAAGGGSIIGENTGLRLRASRIPAYQREPRGTRTPGYIL
jgi:hypothetical protein